MIDFLTNISKQSTNPSFFLYGLGMIYLTGFVLLFSVILKFIEHIIHPQSLETEQKHSFSTFEMTLCVLALFPFWLHSIGQLKIDLTTQYLYFGIGLTLLTISIVWHIWAKINIRYMWSDGIEIKKTHKLITHGAYSYARHPMYASLIMWCLGASLAMFNWVSLCLVCLIFLPLLIIRAKAEEKALITKNKDYLFYQQNVHMLTPTLSGAKSLIIKIIAIALFAGLIWRGITFADIALLFVIHLYLGYSLTPEKVAFSYRSKSGMMLVFWLLSLVWHPFYYLLYLTLLMFVYGLKFNCPCMIVYDKYHRCPCFALVEKCLISNKICKK